jgi:hypothetical protein
LHPLRFRQRRLREFLGRHDIDVIVHPPEGSGLAGPYRLPHIAPESPHSDDLAPVQALSPRVDAPVPDASPSSGRPARALPSPRSTPGSRELLDIFDGNLLLLQRWVAAIAGRDTVGREELLLRSLLTVAVASFETMLANVVRQHFVLFPEALRGREKEFSLSDLEEFDSVADARAAAITRRVDVFMSQSLEHWSRWSEKTIGISLDAAAMDWGRLVEIFQRRHIVVHNASRASRRYIAHLATSSDLPAIGTRLPVTREYLATALDELDAVADVVSYIAWAKWLPGEREIVTSELLHRVYQLLTEGRHLVVQKLAVCLLVGRERA